MHSAIRRGSEVMVLLHGIYVFEWRVLRKRVIQRPAAQMSMLAFLRAVKRRESLPREVLVAGLDRLLYQVYWLHGEQETGRKAVRKVVKVFGNALYRGRDHLMRQAPVVLLPLEYVELGDYWKAGVRIRPKEEPLELFRLEWLLRRREIKDIEAEPTCYSSF